MANPGNPLDQQPPTRLDIPYYNDFPPELPRADLVDMRNVALIQADRELAIRLGTNTVPDDEELSAGVYKEELEPQCRDAIVVARRKGHDTWSSGFGANNCQVAHDFTLTQDDVERLQTAGYTVVDLSPPDSGLPSNPMIKFQPERADLERMKDKWDDLAKLLPDLGAPAPPHTQSLEDFYAKAIRRGVLEG